MEEPEAEPLDAQEEEEGGPVKSFLEHLEDLRWVLIKSVAALGVAILICLIGGNYVVLILKHPLTKTKLPYPGTNQVVTVLFGTNRLGVFTLTAAQQGAVDLGTNRFVAVRVEPTAIGTNRVLAWRTDDNPELAERGQGLNVDLINLSPASGFFVAFQVALYGGIVKERKYVYGGLAYGLTLFLVGVAFCYFVLMPVALAASQKYSQWLGFSAFQWKADDYISFVCKFMLGMGLGFEMPVVILTLVKIGVLNYSILSKARKYMIVVNLVLGAVLTTPEVVTQIIMFLPLQGLFEISIWIAWYWERQDKKREAAAGAGSVVPGT